MKALIANIKVALMELPVFAAVFWHWAVAALPTALLIISVVYGVLNIAYLVWKWRKEAKTKS